MAPWSPDLLFRPGVNVRLGVTHFAPLLARLGGVERALAASRIASFGAFRSFRSASSAKSIITATLKRKAPLQ